MSPFLFSIISFLAEGVNSNGRLAHNSIGVYNRCMEYRPILLTVDCFIKKENKYLLLHRNPQKRILPDILLGPGGKLELKEGLFEATRREIKEETDLNIRNLAIRAVGMAYLMDIHEEVSFHLVTADYASGKVSQNNKDGVLEWYTLKEMLAHPNLLAELHTIAPIIFNSKNPVISYKVIYEAGNFLQKLTIEKP
jgi:8-oxo-dGTP pyrophosphatase MutT (NUDIX family)